MRNYVLALITLGVALTGAAQAAAQKDQPAAAASNAKSDTKFSSSTVWPVTPEFLKAAHAACDNTAPSTGFAECFIGQMAKSGAPADAVAFTRALYANNGQVGMMGEFKGFGVVGLAWIVYPLRANDNDGLLVLNGDPQFLDPDDVQKIDKATLERDPLFIEWKKKAPKLDLWPADRGGGAAQIQFARVWPGDKPGSVSFLFSYPLIDGCHACAHSGFANYFWDFDAQGRFTGTRLVSVTRGAPPIKRARAPHEVAPATAPAAPPASGQPTPSNTPAPPQ